AEDGIRDFHVTGVQTCALPICLGQPYSAPGPAEQLDVKESLEIGDLPAYRALGQGQLLGGPGKALMAGGGLEADQGLGGGYLARSEERRGGKEGRGGWAPQRQK